MGFFDLFRNKKKGKPPHTWYPDILHWEKGDEIYCWDLASASGKPFDLKYFYNRNGIFTVPSGIFTYQSIGSDGVIYLINEDGHLVEFTFWRFIKYARNDTFKIRNLERRLEESNEYMELMENFREAFHELQERDQRPKELKQRKRERS